MPAMRLVALACSNTEIVCALGRGDWLVGVDDHSDHPPEVVGRLPRVGKDLDIDADRVAALEPDLVLASLTVPGHEKVVARLAERRLDLLVLAPKRLADVYSGIELVGRVLDVPDRAADVVGRMRAAIERPAVGDGPPVLVEWWPKPVIAAGARSWVDDLLRAAGASNALGDADCASAVVSDEQVVALAPAAVVVSWCGVRPEKYRPEVVTGRPAWRDVPAVARGQVHCIPEALLGRPGPRLVEGVEALRRVVAGLGDRA